MNRQHIYIFSDPPFNIYDFLNCLPFDVKTGLLLDPDRKFSHLRSGAVSHHICRGKAFLYSKNGKNDMLFDKTRAEGHKRLEFNN
jgi:hypothetical protein